MTASMLTAPRQVAARPAGVTPRRVVSTQATLPRVAGVDVDAEAQSLCLDYVDGYLAEDDVRGQLQELFDSCDIAEDAARRSRFQMSSQMRSDVVDAVNRALLDKIGGHASPTYDLHTGATASFLGWCRQLGRRLVEEHACKMIRQQSRTHLTDTFEPERSVAATSDERLRLICDELDDQAAYRRGRTRLNAAALTAGLQLPVTSPLEAGDRIELMEAIGDDEDLFVEVAVLSFRVAGLMAAPGRGMKAALVRAMLPIWREWKPQAIGWFVDEHASAMVADSVALLAHSVLDPLPRPKVVKMRRAAVRLKGKPGGRVREFNSYASPLVEAWVDRHCEPHEFRATSCSNADGDLAGVCDEPRPAPVPRLDYTDLLAAAAAVVGVPAGTVEGWVEESLNECGAWPGDPFDEKRLQGRANELFGQGVVSM